MHTAAPTLDQFRLLLQTEIGRIFPNQLAFLQSILIEPYQTTLLWEYGQEEEFMAWVFADLHERDVAAQYCRGGQGGLGSPWGINFRTANHFGQDCGWYAGL